MTEGKRREPELQIDEPCSKSWAELEGGGARRFCHECSLHVVDGSAMTRDAARDLVRGSEGRVCMRIEVKGDGRPVHADDDAVRARRERARRRLLAWGLSAAAGALSACDDGRRPAEPAAPSDPLTSAPASGDPTDPAGPVERPPEILGAVCYPHEVGDAGPPTPPRELLGEVDFPDEPADAAATPGEIVGRVKIDPAPLAPDRDAPAPAAGPTTEDPPHIEPR